MARAAVEIPRPRRGEGQWGLGYREPLNAPEQTKKDDDGLNVRERILEYARTGEPVFAADLRSRFRWYGLYTQRPEEDGFFMLRIRIPGGILTSAQLRAIGDIAAAHGRDVADVTDRQNVQLHWIRLADIPGIWERLDEVGLSTLEACGDTPRNVLGCPMAGIDAEEIIDASPLVTSVNARLTGTLEFSNLPRKYKISITGCRHQCAVHEVNDVGLVGVELDDGSRGFDLWVGGGLGPTPHFGKRLGAFVPPEDVVDVCAAVTETFRDFGYRRSRNRARLKFLVADWGPEKFREVVEATLGRPMADGPPAKPSPSAHRDHTGVGSQHDGLNYVGFTLRAGRTSGAHLVALADLAERVGRGRLRTTTQQKMVLLDVPDERLGEAMDALDALGHPVFGSPFRRGTMACTGIEFCKLAIVETKARATWLYDELERRLPDFDEELRINVNGCPNSCARYQLADLGLTGVLVTERTNGAGEVERFEGYNVHLGGRLGDGHAFGRKVPGLRLRADELPAFVERLLRLYLERRGSLRPFGAWIASLGDSDVRGLAKTAAEGLARVGPPPLAEDEIRPVD